MRILFFIASLILSMSFLAAPAFGADPVDALNEQMEKILSPLHNPEGWAKYIKSHPELFGDVSHDHPGSFLGVTSQKVKIDGKEYEIGIGCRSVYIAATPKTVVDIVNNPHYFQSVYGLDKKADIYPINPDGSFKAHVFKLVPGVETQDYTLSYTGGWQTDGSWIGQSRQTEDQKGFALRNNMKIVQPSGSGTVYREVALLYPRRWWVRLFHGLAQSIFKKELGKLNVSLKCVCEKVQSGTPMSDTVGKTCFKEAEK